MGVCECVHAHGRNKGLGAEIIEDLELGINVIDTQILKTK